MSPGRVALTSFVVRALAAFVTGRRTKWLVLALWIVLAVALAGPGSKLADETNNETESFLPDDAESTRGPEAAERPVRGGEDDARR